MLSIGELFILGCVMAIPPYASMFKRAGIGYQIFGLCIQLVGLVVQLTAIYMYLGGR